MSTPRKSFKESDHVALLLLIRGFTMAEAALEMSIDAHALATRIQRLRQMMDCRTTYQLVALEVVNLMEAEAEPAILGAVVLCVESPKVLAATV